MDKPSLNPSPKGITCWLSRDSVILDTEGRIMIWLDKTGNYNHGTSPKPENRFYPKGYDHRAARRRRFRDRVCWWLMDRAAWLDAQHTSIDWERARFVSKGALGDWPMHYEGWLVTRYV